MTENILEMRSISKSFPGVKALSEVSLSVRRGEVHAICGENGAGKSTLMKVLSGVYPHGTYEGEIHFDGNLSEFSGISDSEKAGIAIIHQELALVPFLSIAENLFLGNEIKGRGGLIDWHRTNGEAQKLLRRVGLDENPTTPIGQLGVGKQQLAEIAKALSKEVKLLILDEPTAGVDIQLRQQLWDYVRELNASGVTVVLTTHYLEEAEQLCDRIAIINHGRVVANEPTRALVGMAQEKAVELTLDRDLADLPDAGCFEKVERKGDRVLAITYRKDVANAGEVLAAVAAQGYGIVDVVTREADLEDVFLNLTNG